MPIPDAERAIVEPQKVRDYLLNVNHPDGGPKARWFHLLGYTRDDWQILADDIERIARDCEQFETQTTPFGIKYKAVGPVGDPPHRPGSILTVWIVEDDHPPRLVTAYPEPSP